MPTADMAPATFRSSAGLVRIAIALAGFISDPLINGVWNANFNGHGIAYAGLKCGTTDDPAEYSRTYPRGKPELSRRGACSPCWDPRDPAQLEGDETTWLVSYNPVIQLIDYLTRVDGGMGLDRAIILPAAKLAEWMVEAGICDVALRPRMAAPRRDTSHRDGFVSTTNLRT
jgi:hypothetical protein